MAFPFFGRFANPRVFFPLVTRVVGSPHFFQRFEFVVVWAIPGLLCARPEPGPPFFPFSKARTFSSFGGKEGALFCLTLPP